MQFRHTCPLITGLTVNIISTKNVNLIHNRTHTSPEIHILQYAVLFSKSQTSDFDHHIFRHHYDTVPGGQIAMNELLSSQVRHPVRDLPRHL